MKKTKAMVEKKVTPKAVDEIYRIFTMEAVPDDEAIVAKVNKYTGKTGFNMTQLAWYKSKFRNGHMKGQGGKKAEIRQKVKNAGIKGAILRDKKKIVVKKGEVKVAIPDRRKAGPEVLVK